MTALGWWSSVSRAQEPWRRHDQPRLRTIALTATGDELEHRVAVDDFERGAGDPGTPIVTCCGLLVLPAPLSTPPGPVCRRCAGSTAPGR